MGGPWWNTVSCDRIKQELIAQPSLFNCPHEIRCALIPSGAGACTAAQCNTTPPPCTGTCPSGQRWDTPTCRCVDNTTPPPPTPGDNTMLLVGLGAVALVGILLATGSLGGGGGPKTLYAKPA